MDSFTVCRNGLFMEVRPNTNLPDWTKQVLQEVLATVRNGHATDLVRVGDRVLFLGGEMNLKRAKIRRRYSTWVEYTEEEVWMGFDRNADGSRSEGRWVVDDASYRTALATVEEDLAHGIVHEVMAALDR